MYTRHCLRVRRDFFISLLEEKSLNDRIRVSTLFYKSGIAHSNLIIVDDQVLSMGSTNANQCGFFVDTELNVIFDHSETVKNFRKLLWSHNPESLPAIVARWKGSDYITQWDVVASHNKTHEKTPNKMVGEGFIRINPLDPTDTRSKINMESVPGLPDTLC